MRRRDLGSPFLLISAIADSIFDVFLVLVVKQKKKDAKDFFCERRRERNTKIDRREKDREKLKPKCDREVGEERK